MRRKITLLAAILCFAFTLCPCVAQPDFLSKSTPLKHLIIFSKPDKFAAWPANNGVWMWEAKEILVGFSYGDYKVKESHDITGPTFNVLGRSTDGGRTWKIEYPENFAGDDIEPKPSPGGINFAHPDFAMRLGGNQFFISYDRGKNWKGPYLFGDFGLPESELTEITSRTDYIVNGPKDCFIFTSVRNPGKFGTDRAFCMRTQDAGLTFKFARRLVSAATCPYVQMYPCGMSWITQAACQRHAFGLRRSLSSRSPRAIGIFSSLIAQRNKLGVAGFRAWAAFVGRVSAA